MAHKDIHKNHTMYTNEDGKLVRKWSDKKIEVFLDICFPPGCENIVFDEHPESVFFNDTVIKEVSVNYTHGKSCEVLTKVTDRCGHKYYADWRYYVDKAVK